MLGKCKQTVVMVPTENNCQSLAPLSAHTVTDGGYSAG